MSKWLDEQKKDLLKEFIKSISATKNDDYDFTNSWRLIFCINPSGEMSFVKAIRQNDVNNGVDILDDVRFYNDNEYYITKNSFKVIAKELFIVKDKKNYKRVTENLFSLDNIVIDIDAHNIQDFDDIDREIDKLLFYVDNDYDRKLPEFNIVRTGRGVHLWFGLESFSAKLLDGYKKLCKGLCGFFSKVIIENDLKLTVDTNACENAVGLMRLPYTYHAKRRRPAQLDIKTTERYSLQELRNDYDLNPTKTNKPKATSTAPKDKPSVLTDEEQERYKVLHRKRMWFITELIRRNAGDCEGRRQIMLYFWYNAAVQVLELGAAQKGVKELNQRFTIPLGDRELKDTINGIDRHGENLKGGKGFYYYTVDEWLARLECTEEEKLIYNSKTSREIASDHNKAERADRDKLIHQLAAEGLSTAMIAARVGCSESTVRRQLQPKKSEKARKTAKTKRNNKIKALHNKGFSIREIAARVGCAPNTVQSVLRAEQAEVKALEKKEQALETVNYEPLTAEDTASVADTADMFINSGYMLEEFDESDFEDGADLGGCDLSEYLLILEIRERRKAHSKAWQQLLWTTIRQKEQERREQQELERQERWEQERKELERWKEQRAFLS